MKHLLCALGLATLASIPAKTDFSTTFNSGFTDNGMIPDGSTIGLADTRVLNVPFNTIQDVNVRVDIAGGWNGDDVSIA